MKAKVLFFLLLIGSFTTSCNKAHDPIVLTGEWNIDLNYVYNVIHYDPSFGASNPTAVQFLIDHQDDLTAPLKLLKQITFSENGTITFTYNDDSVETGTYTQDDTYFEIVSSAYPYGLAGATDGSTMELYYPLEYMDNILYGLLTESDPSEATFNTLIQTFLGVATYRSSTY